MNSQNIQTRYILLSSSILFLLTTYVLLIVSDNPAKSYEISIYSSTPFIFWFTIIIGLFNGIFIIVLALYRKIDKIWILGLFEIIFFNILVISLYAIRGYILYLGRGDTASYVGMAKDVINYGYFFDYNFYPLMSILIAQINQMTNISVLGISRYLSSLFFIIYFLTIYCLAKSIYDKKFIFACVIASAPILFPWFSTSIYHMLLSVLMIPTLFYCLQRNSDNRFKFLSIILVVMYPFFHPMTSVLILIYLLIIYISKTYIYKLKTISIFLVYIAFASFMSWFITQYFILHSFKLVISQMFDFSDMGSTASQVEYYTLKLGLADSIRSFLFMDAHIIILYIISLCAILYIMCNKRLLDKSSMGDFSTMMYCFIIGNLLIFIIFFTSNSHNPDRLINLNPNMVFTPILIGYLIRVLKQNKILIIGLIIFSAITSVFSLYQSPIVTQPNDHMTTNDIISAEWLLYNKNVEIKTAYILSPLGRYADMTYGYSLRSKRDDIYRGMKNIPDHFGFSDGIFPIDKDRYLIITEYDIQAYTQVWRNIDRFNKDDFINLDSSKNTNKVYDSKEVSFYLINKTFL